MKVIGFLKTEGGLKDEQLVSLHGELGKAQEVAGSERRCLEEQYETTVKGLEDQLQERTEEVSVSLAECVAVLVASFLLQLSVMQGELKTVKEFRRHRAEMEAQLMQLRVTLTDSDQEHQSALQSLEHRFFEEKVFTVCVCVGWCCDCVSH